MVARRQSKPYFVWGFVKDQVYANTEEIKRMVRKAFDVLMLRRVWADIEHRLYYLRPDSDYHLEMI